MLPDLSQIDPTVTAAFGVCVAVPSVVLGWVIGRWSKPKKVSPDEFLLEQLAEREREIDALSLELKRFNDGQSLANLAKALKPKRQLKRGPRGRFVK